AGQVPRRLSPRWPVGRREGCRRMERAGGDSRSFAPEAGKGGPMTSLERPAPPAQGPSGEGAVEEVEVRGHIVDSLLLPKILDRILQLGGSFEIRECRIGARRVDPSYAR